MSVHLRVARPTDNIDDLVHFYGDGLGFEVIASFFVDHNGFDGVMLGHPGEQYHFEFTCKWGHHTGRAPTEDNLLVFYLSNREEWQRAVQRMLDCGYKPVTSFNPYTEEVTPTA